MAAAGLQSTDVLHYESRAIRAGLKASINRLASAKGYIPSSLTPEELRQHGVPQDWSAPKVIVDFEESSPLGSGDPQFEEMRSALLQFERSSYQAASSKERAFYSALRTLLADITVTKEDEARATHITAAYKWFSKHRPRGYSEDPSVFAAMAMSLSLQGVQPSQVHATTSASTGAERPHGTQGTKHEFFAIFSKESRGASPERTAGPSSGRTPSTAAAAAAAAASSAGGGGGGGRRPSASFAPPPRTSIMPVVMQPAVPHAHGGPTRDTPPRHEGRVGGGAAMAAAAAAAAAGSLPAVGSRSSGDGGRGGGSDGAGPSGGARGWARPGGAEGKGQPAGPQQQQQQQQQRTPWNSGPFREPGALGTGRGKVEEAEEIEALRRKWSAMDAATSRSVVEAQMQQWSAQRARLEEEIIRRQEASRYASPSLHAQGALAGPSLGGQAKAEGYMSPYAGLVSHQMGVDTDAPPAQIPGLMLPPSVTATAREVRAKAGEQHAREAMKITRRLAQLGMHGAVSQEAVDHALGPVPDKAYLECLAKLPRPGDLLPSKPGSARTGAGGTKKGRKRSKSAGRTRAL